MTATCLTLYAQTARDLMTDNPVSIAGHASVQDAVKLMVERHISGAPVIDNAGRPIGVVTQTDVLVHDRESVDYLKPRPSEDEANVAPTQVEAVQVRDIMTPVVFTVSPDTPATKVISEMLSLNVHRLFVVDRAGILVGVIGTLDVLRALRE